MAADEESRDAIIAEVHRFFSDDTISTADAQRRLAAVLRALGPRPRK
jgi:glucose/mannose transport system substrate-binding protein